MATGFSQVQQQSFRHGRRTGVALLPSLLLVTEIGGKAAIGVLLVRPLLRPAPRGHPGSLHLTVREQGIWSDCSLWQAEHICHKLL